MRNIDMINLHKFYYKDYFSGIDFSSITKKEMIEEKKKQRKELESQNDPVTRNVKIPNLDREIKSLGDDLERITNCNKQSVSERNEVLIADNYTEEILKDCNPPRVYKEDEEKTKPIELKIQYPGLVTGVGIDHEAKIEGEFKLGVHFDWTYGMPVIYGSSVKGVLRSALIAKTEKGKIVEYDDYFLKQATGRNWSQEEMDILFNDIFNGKKFVKEVEDDGKKIREYQNKSIYERDIFFDAVITAPDKKGRILCSDSITPHGDNPLKNPTPITFLKIASGCKLKFRFKLAGSEEEKELKRKLFKEILTTVGVGAKTNVGYGQLKEAK